MGEGQAEASINRCRALRALDFLSSRLFHLCTKESFSAWCSGQIAPLLHRLIAFTRGKVRQTRESTPVPRPPRCTATAMALHFRSPPSICPPIPRSCCYLLLPFPRPSCVYAATNRPSSRRSAGRSREGGERPTDTSCRLCESSDICRHGAQTFRPAHSRPEQDASRASFSPSPFASLHTATPLIVHVATSP